MITVSIVEDNFYFRKAIIGSLQSRDIFQIKGTYAAAEPALKGLLKDKPDVAIIDVEMPGMNGIELIMEVMAAL